MREIEVPVMSGQDKGEWVVMWGELKISHTDVVKALRKRPCFKNVHGDKTSLHVAPAPQKEQQAMIELLSCLSPSLTSKEPKLDQLIMHARALWYDEN